MYEIVPLSHTCASVAGESATGTIQDPAARAEATTAVKLLHNSLHTVSLVSHDSLTVAGTKKERITEKGKESRQRKRKCHPR